MAVATTGWFSFVSCVFSREAARRAFLRGSHWIDRLLGVVFLSFGVALLFAHV
jgi:threonine/homoserine/homoserine lactone efflux protein